MFEHYLLYNGHLFTHTYIIAKLKLIVRLFFFSKNYMAGPAELLFNDKTTGVKGINVVFDSGSSYTYFNDTAYKAILDLVRQFLL